jgi:cell division protein ZapA
MAADDKRSVRVTIYNQTYALLVSGDPREIEDAAQEVDDLMTAIGKSSNMETSRIAVLACLHLQDRVKTLERELRQFRDEVETRSREFSILLDEVIR